jgi:hypothetical protein
MIPPSTLDSDKTWQDSSKAMAWTGLWSSRRAAVEPENNHYYSTGQEDAMKQTRFINPQGLAKPRLTRNVITPEFLYSAG